MTFPSHDILPDQEQRALALKAQAGDKDAAERLIAHHQRLVYQTARRREYMAGAHSLEDLVQWGNIGLLEAIRKFDPSYKSTFFTYAVWWVRAAINRFCYQNEHTVSVPIRHMQRLQRARYLRSHCYQQNGVEPTTADIAGQLGYDPAEIEALFQASEPISWDVVRDAEDRPIDELVSLDESGVEDKVFDGILARAALEFIETELDERTRAMLFDAFGFHGRALTMHEIARKYGVSECEAGGVINRTLEKIRGQLDEEVN